MKANIKLIAAVVFLLVLFLAIKFDLNDRLSGPQVSYITTASQPTLSHGKTWSTILKDKPTEMKKSQENFRNALAKFERK